MIKAIIFDCFGVLAGSGFKEIYRQAGGNLEKDGSFIDDVLAAANSGTMSTRNMHQQVANRIGMTYDVWYETVQKNERPNEELLDYIKGLKSRYKVAILSNANHGTLQRKFSPEQLNIFDQLTVSAEVGLMKPNAEIYTYTAEKLGVEAEECLFTDDSPAYCEASEAVGMKSIHYSDFATFKAALEKLLANSNS